MLVTASFISYVLRYNVSTAGPTMMADLGLSEIQFGWVLAAFTAGYALFQFPGGVLTSAIGARRTLAGIMVLWAILTVVTSMVPQSDSASTTTIIVSLITVRFLVGAAHAPIYPLTGGVVERWFPIGGWALPNGLSSTGLTLGTAATAPVLAWLMLQYGWRMSFVLLAPLGLLGAALWWWYFRDDPAEHASTNDAEVELIFANRPSPPPATDASPVWLRVLKSRDALLLMVSYFCMNYVFYQMFNWVFYYLVTVREFSGQEAGFMSSFQWVAAAIGATLGGLVCDALCRRFGIRLGCRIPAMVGLLLSAAFLVGGAISANPYLAVVGLAGSFFFNQLTEAAYWTAAIGIGGRHAATACGVMNTGGNMVGFVNALLVPWSAQLFGWTFAMSTGAIFALIGAGAWLFVRPDQPIAD